MSEKGYENLKAMIKAVRNNLYFQMTDDERLLFREWPFLLPRI